MLKFEIIGEFAVALELEDALLACRYLLIAQDGEIQCDMLRSFAVLNWESDQSVLLVKCGLQGRVDSFKNVNLN